MNKIQRISGIFTAIIMILCALILILVPETGYSLVVIILSVSLVVMAVRKIVYYFSMARHMVGGKSILCVGVILLDLGLFTMTFSNVNSIYIKLYLMATLIFSGVIHILQAFEEKRLRRKNWVWKFTVGAIFILLPVACIVLFKGTNIFVYIYSGVLIYTAVTRISAAFRKTSIIYIEP